MRNWTSTRCCSKTCGTAVARCGLRRARGFSVGTLLQCSCQSVDFLLLDLKSLERTVLALFASKTNKDTHEHTRAHAHHTRTQGTTRDVVTHSPLHTPDSTDVYCMLVRMCSSMSTVTQGCFGTLPKLGCTPCHGQSLTAVFLLVVGRRHRAGRGCGHMHTNRSRTNVTRDLVDTRPAHPCLAAA